MKQSKVEHTSATCISASSRGAEKSPNRFIPFLSPSACKQACKPRKTNYYNTHTEISIGGSKYEAVEAIAFGRILN